MGSPGGDAEGTGFLSWVSKQAIYRQKQEGNVKKESSPHEFPGPAVHLTHPGRPKLLRMRMGKGPLITQEHPASTTAKFSCTCEMPSCPLPPRGTRQRGIVTESDQWDLKRKGPGSGEGLPYTNPKGAFGAVTRDQH